MLDFSKMEQLGEDIYVYKNFLTFEEQKYFTQKAIMIPESEWNNPDPTKNWMKYSNPDSDLEMIRQKISNLILDKDIFLGPSTSFTKMVTGGTWGEHSDDHDFLETLEEAKLYKEGDPYDLKQDSVWGLVVYFNYFVGGQIYYPLQDIEYKPIEGDLLIHSSRNHCRHGVREVSAGIRITHSNNMYKMIKVPKR
jgi:hypothetical protein